MEKKKIIGYRCKADREYQFTKGKIYKLRPGKNLWSYEAFIDDRGEPNGWSIYNDEHFEPVYEEENYKLLEKWYIKGGIELSRYFNDNNILNPATAYSDYGYYSNNKGIWVGTDLKKFRDYQEITLTQYLNSINNKMENKKIYYLKQEVKLNQEIDFNGLKITVTQDLINNNPNLFHVEEKYDTVLCINDYIGFKKGNTYKSIINITNNTIKIFGSCNLTTELYNNHFVKIDGIKYLKYSSGFIHKYYINVDSKGSYIYYDTFGNECNRSNVIQFESVSTEEEYDKQVELQQLLDEAQKRYPVGTKLSKSLTVTLHPDKKTYLVYPNKTVDVHIGDNKYTAVKTNVVDWRIEYKEPVKDLKYYKSLYSGSFYIQLRVLHPNLYYQLMLQTIADDLNGDWTIDWNNTTNRKYCIQFCNGDIEIDGYYNLIHSNVYFKTKAHAQKAIDILGEDKLKIIFNVK